MHETPFEKAKPIIKTILDHGYEAYFVGGCVRDFLLNRPIGDIDITTSATPEVIMKIFPRVIPVGIDHGTVIVRYQHESYEVTTFRLDGKYSDYRHPDSVTFISNIEEDLKRRDFTINAMAMDIDGNIIDLFGGQEDLSNQQIRTVGCGYDRFLEDPLRILRAIRFSSQLGFSIENNTLDAIQRVKDKMTNIAVERIAKELEKTFAGTENYKGIHYLIQTGVQDYLPLFGRYPSMLQQVTKGIRPLVTLSETVAYLHLLQPDIAIRTFIDEWKCSNTTRREAMMIADAYHHFKENGIDEWIAYQLPPSLYEGFIHVLNSIEGSSAEAAELYRLYEKLPIQERKDLAVDGKDILDIFPQRKKGPWIKELLNNIEKMVVFGQLENNKEQIKEWIRCHPPEIN